MMKVQHLAQSAIDNPLLPSNVINGTGVAYTSELITNFLALLLIAIFLLFFGYLIFGAISWIMAGGDKGNVEAARKRVTTAVVGITLVFSTWALVTLVEFVFSVDILTMDISRVFLNEADSFVSLIRNPYIVHSSSALGSIYLTKLVTTFIILAIVVGTIAFFFMLVIGGIGWMASGGDKGKVETARGQITSAVTGLVVMLSIWIIISLAGTFFGLDLVSGFGISEYFLGETAIDSDDDWVGGVNKCRCNGGIVDESRSECLPPRVPVCLGGPTCACTNKEGT